MKTTAIFGLIVLVAAVLGVTTDRLLLRILALVVVAAAAVLMGIALGSNPFKQ